MALKALVHKCTLAIRLSKAPQKIHLKIKHKCFLKRSAFASPNMGLYYLYFYDLLYVIWETDVLSYPEDKILLS